MKTAVLDLNPQVDKLYRLEGEGAVRAFADVSIDGKMLIKGVRVVEGNKGLFVSMPREQGKDGKWYDRVRVLDDRFKDQLAEVVLQAYEKGGEN